MKERPLIAILRGVQPFEVIDIARGIVDAGIDKIEVPFNSPKPLESIGLLIDTFGDQINIGAGTVVTVEQVEQVSAIGGQFIVSPNCNVEVIAKTKALGMASYPGVLTPTECYAAIDAGADAIKLFPASVVGTKGLSAYRAILPPDIDVYVVGGADASNFSDWYQAGAKGFGLGASLYRAGDTAEKVAAAANSAVAAFDALMDQ